MKTTKLVKQEPIEDISDQLNKRSVSKSREIEQLQEADKQKEALIYMNESLGVSNEQLIKTYKEKEMVLNRISDAVVSVDNDWRYTFLNDAALATHPLGKEGTLGKVIWDVHPEMKGTIFWDKYHEAMHTRKVVEIEDHFAPMDIWFSVKVYPSSDGLTIFYRNITESKKAEQQLSLLNTALEGRASELAASNDELERFAYVASHDLQEPLRMVSGFLQLLENKYSHQLDETAQKYINFAVDGAARMRILILDLLEFSRITTAKKGHTIINLNELVHKTLEMLQTGLDEVQASVTIAKLPEVSGDESQLIQLFQNLISNALKYRRDLKPMIELGFTEKNDVWEFFVKDNGMGIDAVNFDKIFDIFQRLHNRSEYPGTGIGLAICKKIVELHQGKIWVESSKEKGSTFYFTIPKFKQAILNH